VLLAQLASGATVKDAAMVAGVSESTAYRRRRDPDFRAQLAEHQRELVEETLGLLVAEGPRSVQRLAALRDDPETPPSVAVAAARVILAYISELGAVPGLAGRLDAIESALGIAGNGAGS
jgi:hypothetical protein